MLQAIRCADRGVTVKYSQARDISYMHTLGGIFPTADAVRERKLTSTNQQATKVMKEEKIRGKKNGGKRGGGAKMIAAGFEPATFCVLSRCYYR
jgi:hypothetical protein